MAEKPRTQFVQKYYNLIGVVVVTWCGRAGGGRGGGHCERGSAGHTGDRGRAGPGWSAQVRSAWQQQRPQTSIQGSAQPRQPTTSPL